MLRSLPLLVLVVLLCGCSFQYRTMVRHTIVDKRDRDRVERTVRIESWVSVKVRSSDRSS